MRTLFIFLALLFTATLATLASVHAINPVTAVLFVAVIAALCGNGYAYADELAHAHHTLSTLGCFACSKLHARHTPRLRYEAPEAQDGSTDLRPYQLTLR